MTENILWHDVILSKILLTLAVGVGVFTVAAAVRRGFRAALQNSHDGKGGFWADQAIKLTALGAFLSAGAAIWGGTFSSLGGAIGLIGAGLAVALQRVVTAFAAYLIILRGNLFSVGDRITIGGVRGDVIELGFMQTTVLEMGQSPPEQADEPATWVRGRQYTGRVVRVTNDKIFETPVYNYTQEFPFVWDEIVVPVHHGADLVAAERILLSAARGHTQDVVDEARPALENLRTRYFIKGEIEIDPRVYVVITDNYLELSLRFLSREPGVRILKDALFRTVLTELKGAGISIASTSTEISVTSPLSVSVSTAD